MERIVMSRGKAIALILGSFFWAMPHVRASEPTVTFAFWNVENLFDCVNDPKNPGDDEFLPAKGWTEDRYRLKLKHLAEVIAALDSHVLGLAEVENRRVLEDLLGETKLHALGYRIAHRDSPDKRGIDLALLYRAPFQLAKGSASVKLHSIPINPPTRGILEVQLLADGQALTVLINHWPSRRGGTRDTAPLRKIAAERCREIVLARQDAASRGVDPDILLLGDLNDDPYDDAVRRTLKAVRSRNATLNNRTARFLYNPSWVLLGRTDVGTLYYNREWVWNVFDQCVLSRGLLKEPGFCFLEGSLDIYADEKMRDQHRRPLAFRPNRRTSQWVEGFSDHFPIVGRLTYKTGTAAQSGSQRALK